MEQYTYHSTSSGIELVTYFHPFTLVSALALIRLLRQSTVPKQLLVSASSLFMGTLWCHATKAPFLTKQESVDFVSDRSRLQRACKAHINLIACVMSLQISKLDNLVRPASS